MCVKPVTIFNQNKDRYIPVPCGQCPECVKNRINSWIFRINKHSKISYNSVFLTLTYDPDNLPFTPCGKPTLVKKDIQNFMKSLRQEQKKYYSDTKITYYGCGEYGKKGGRPHYHLLLFNVHPKIDYSRVWKKGFALPLPAKEGSFKYVLKYMSKQKTKTKKDVQQIEFSLMSKGIGKNYLTPAIKQYHSDLENCFVTTENGYKMPMPKYYKEKLYDDEQRALVTDIIQKRCDIQYDKTVKYLLKITDDPLKLLQIRKDNLKFETRLIETI